MHQNKNDPHILQEISTNILTKMSDITGSPHWACSEKCKQKKLVTENSISTVCSRCSRNSLQEGRGKKHKIFIIPLVGILFDLCLKQQADIYGYHSPSLTPLVIKRRLKRIGGTALQPRTYAELVPLSYVAQSVLNCLFLPAITLLFTKDNFHIVYFEVLLRTWVSSGHCWKVSIFSNSDKF